MATEVVRKLLGVHDELLIRREIYNPNKFPISFWRQTEMDGYIRKSGVSLGPKMVYCAPDGFCMLNHAYYNPKAENGGEPFDVLMNYGNAIGIGNKKNSLPIVE